MIGRESGGRKRAPLPIGRCNCSPICRKHIWRLGFSYYYGDNNYEAALREFRDAQRGLPNESEVYLAIGAIQRRQGKWAESTANLEKAASLNPNDTWVLQNLAFNYHMQRNFDAANKTIDRALQMNPQGISLWEIKAKLAVGEKGDFSVGEKLLEKAKSFPMSNEERLTLLGGQVNLLLLQRKYKEVLEMATKLFRRSFRGGSRIARQKYFAIGLAQKGLHDEASGTRCIVESEKHL